jgi:hypothetical protein
MEITETEIALANIAKAKRDGAEYAGDYRHGDSSAFSFGALGAMYRLHVSRLESELASSRRKIADLEAQIEEALA